ncbi:MAG TPA: ABC transporter substrate-binding protein [Candidatus Acidoferrales bacterium]|nr:ABC transporter substrate-binding protein [Candidatus Acidoferrales bacterium]
MSLRQRDLTVFIVAAAVLASLILRETSVAADRVRIGYTSPGPQHGILWVGDVSGIFKKNNLDLEIIYMPGNISIASLLSGEIQFGQMTGALMSPARLQGADPVMLVSIQELLDDRMVVRPNIKTPEDLKGKRIAISRFGAASHMRVINILPRFGLSEKDVTFLQIGDTPARIVALAGNAVDASSFSPPDHLAAVQTGMRILFNMADFNIFYQGTGLVTTQRNIAKSRDVVKRMVKSYVEAIHVVRTNPEQTKRAFVKYRKTRDEKQLEDAYQTLRETVKQKPYPNLEAFKTIFKDVTDRIPAAKTANAKEFVDISFLEELDKSGYIDGLYR